MARIVRIRKNGDIELIKVTKTTLSPKYRNRFIDTDFPCDECSLKYACKYKILEMINNCF